MKANNNSVAEYLFHKGENYHAYNYLGSFFRKDYTVFRVWAKNAKKVFVTGDFNDWNYYSHEMNKVNDNGIFEIKIKGVKNFDCYKYVIVSGQDKIILKSDPYARHFETRPNTSSKVYSSKKFKWTDKKWINRREIPYNLPLNIYEFHMGSWKKYGDGEFFNYRKVADELSKYLVEMGYTHVEVMPVTEYPYDKSWGYQVTGYFAPTSRYGLPEDFKYFINKMHENNIGVIIDWVPGHFPRDQYGLASFDGTYLYEYDHPFKREHKGWGTLVFDYGKNEVISFLISSAVYWIEEFHVDGLRVDAVTSMIYLNYDRNDNEWEKNKYGGSGNLEAIDFLKRLNKYIHENYPSVMTIAEESTDWPNITNAHTTDGLCFNFKWNMGWMNDALSYLTEDPFFRKYKHEKLTFPLLYAFNENYILPISHDEVVHGKKSLLDKSPVGYNEKFSNFKIFLSYMYSQPGKKLTFMGSEFGQFIEWDENKEIDWILLNYDKHKKLLYFVKKLNYFYINNKEFWEDDHSWNGFRWHKLNDKDNNIFAYSRISKNKSEILIVLNFSGQKITNYKIGVEKNSNYKKCFSTEDKIFGGTGLRNYNIKTHNSEYDGFESYIKINLEPFSAIFLRKL